MDKVKTKIQSQRKKYPFISTVKNIYYMEGIRGFYKGLTAIIVGIAPEKTLKLTVNAHVKQKMRKEDELFLPIYKEALAGLITGLTQVTLTTPYEFVKIRCQMVKGKDIVSPITVIRQNGIRGMYRGYSATLMRDVPFNLIYFSLYNFWKNKFGVNPTALEVLLCSASAEAIAAFVDTPADCIKTRMQNGRVAYTGIVDCIKETYRIEGYVAFLKGAPLRVAVITPLFGITFMVFEGLKTAWRTQFPQYT